MPWWGGSKRRGPETPPDVFFAKGHWKHVAMPRLASFKTGGGESPHPARDPPPGVGAPKIGLSKGISKKIQCTMPGPRAQDCPTPNPPPPSGSSDIKRSLGRGLAALFVG